MCHFLELEQNPEEEWDGEDNKDGSDEISEPGRAGGFDCICTLLLGMPTNQPIQF